MKSGFPTHFCVQQTEYSFLQSLKDYLEKLAYVRLQKKKSPQKSLSSQNAIIYNIKKNEGNILTTKLFLTEENRNSLLDLFCGREVPVSKA